MKKGFTLIELLAVIVILAVIMVIAVPQILKVIDSSRKSAWTDNVKLIKNAVELEYSMNSTSATISSTNCTPANLQNKLIAIAKLDTNSTSVTNISYSNGTCTFKINPTGQFTSSENKTATLTCASGRCTITYAQ